jgi:phosphotransferase system HPr (HPr) family protein
MEFHATVILRNRHDETADARNILGLLLLGARHGDRVHLRSLGYDATEAMTAIAAVLSR